MQPMGRMALLPVEALCSPWVEPPVCSAFCSGIHLEAESGLWHQQHGKDRQILGVVSNRKSGVWAHMVLLTRERQGLHFHTLSSFLHVGDKAHWASQAGSPVRWVQTMESALLRCMPGRLDLEQSTQDPSLLTRPSAYRLYSSVRKY